MSDEQQVESSAALSAPLSEQWESGQCKPPSVAMQTVHNMVDRYLASALPEEAKGLSGSNIDIIIYLDHHQDDEIFPQDIERHFGVTRSTSCRVLGLMEKKGLIARESVTRDARLKRIVLTDQAKAAAEALHESAKAMERQLLQGLSDDDIRQLLRSLERMQRNLESTGKVGKCYQHAQGLSSGMCDETDMEDQEEGVKL